MRRRVSVAILAILIIGGFGIVGQAQAGVYFYDGNQLMEFYKEYVKAAEYTGDKSITINWIQNAVFSGYVTGVFDSHKSELCTPEGKIIAAAVCAIVGNYLKAHPEEWGKSGDVIVLKALKEAYPCPKGGRK